MAIRGRIKTEIKLKMIEMAEGESSIEDIAKETGASVKQVINVLEKYEQSETGDEPEIETIDSNIDWKEKYIQAHIKLVEHGIE